MESEWFLLLRIDLVDGVSHGTLGGIEATASLVWGLGAPLSQRWGGIVAWRLPAAVAVPRREATGGSVSLWLSNGAAICVRTSPLEPWVVAESIPQPAGWGSGCVPDPEGSARLLLGPELKVGTGLVELTYLGDRTLSWRMPGHSTWKRLRRDESGKGLLLVPAKVCLLQFSNRIPAPARDHYLVIDP